MQMNVQRAAQERECGIGKSHDETDQIEDFPVHGFTSLILTLLNVARLTFKPRSFPERSSAATADAARATVSPPAPAFPGSLPSAPGSSANLCAWPGSAARGSPADRGGTAPLPGSATDPAYLPRGSRPTLTRCGSPRGRQPGSQGGR